MVKERVFGIFECFIEEGWANNSPLGHRNPNINFN
jgi:hypothetical protein